MPNSLVWMIFLLPLISFVLIALFIKPFLNNSPRISGYITISAVAGSLILSLWLLTSLLNTPSHELIIPDFNWLIIEGSINIHLGLTIDMLTVIMCIVVTTVSLMVQIYSQGYMHGDPGYHRYYVYMSLFTTAMLGLVMVDNLLLMYVFWELVGLCSYLLIGFWFHRPAAARAAKKAFIVTRLGDFGFLAAILVLFFSKGTLDVSQLHGYAVAGAIGSATLTWAAIGIFLGAAGKSAQFPLHVWLPDAMEGPTPVSALIHAATMVAAGVFLVARMFPLFEHSPEALSIVAYIGGFTAIFAATMGLVMNDIKRVLAYSTISQLGYMMLGLGVGGVAIGIFHLFNHAFFKALLFLGAGSVNHGTKTFDMRFMGGLRKVMPWTYATFLIASLSIAGIWPLAGFWSKDEILASALSENTLLFVLSMITVFMTAFYMFRVVFMTFGGEYRGSEKPHESPPVMVVPMVVLAVLAVVSGWFNATGGFSHLLGHGESHSFTEGFFGILSHPLPWISLAMAGSGILLAYAMYSAKWISPHRIAWFFRSLYVLFSKKYWMDELYEDAIGQRLLSDRLFAGMKLLDSKVIDGAVNGVADTVVDIGNSVRRAQSGQLQLYGLFIILGVLAIVISLLIWG
ncbi:MAG TPA: NADH-quinone oxidoreductase subunit L [Dehalococcoidia bacterium]|nr:NADH-quinone oxidoreductase subunit L [Dehalococcoidia bacterium]